MGPLIGQLRGEKCHWLLWLTQPSDWLPLGLLEVVLEAGKVIQYIQGPKIVETQVELIGVCILQLVHRIFTGSTT